MKEINLPPFYVGQKVVAVNNSALWKKGQEFTIKSITKSCCYWEVDINLSAPNGISFFRCYICNRKHGLKPGDPIYPDAYCFAPLEEKFEVISYKKVIKREQPVICRN